MELAAADIDPHIARTGVEVRIAGEAETGNVERRRLQLIADTGIDMFQCNDVADICGAEVELRHDCPRSIDYPVLRANDTRLMVTRL